MSFDLIQFIHQNEESCREVLDLIPIPLFIKDVHGSYLSCNKAYEKISRMTCQQMIGKMVYDLWPKNQADMFYLKDKELFDSPGEQIYEADISASFDKKCIVQFQKATFSNEKGEIIGLIGAIFDITEKTELEETLKKLSETDDLTDLLNRRTGLELMNKVLNQSKRKGRNFVIATMDLDRFKNINDSYGHEVGDRVLQSVKAFTSNILRDYDILTRYGGDEFVFCFPDANLDEAQTVLERIRKAFEAEKILAVNEKYINITVSIGVASFPDHGETINELINASDRALYDAKSVGRNCIQLAATAS